MKRYHFDAEWSGQTLHENDCMVRWEHGDWVKYADCEADREEQAKVYTAGMAEAEKQIDRLIGEKEKLVGALNDAQIVLSMVGKLTQRPSFETQDDIMCRVVIAKRKARAILSELE